MPSSQIPPLANLEKLPYLTAVYFEILRISYGVSHRPQRVYADQAITYHDYVLPPETSVSITNVHIHDNAAIFSESRIFKPQRWLPQEMEGARLRSTLLPSVAARDNVSVCILDLQKSTWRLREYSGVLDAECGLWIRSRQAMLSFHATSLRRWWIRSRRESWLW